MSVEKTHRVKQTYEVGDRVFSPLGEGTIISSRICDQPEGQMMCTVKHDTYEDDEGDTFELKVQDLSHVPKHQNAQH